MREERDCYWHKYYVKIIWEKRERHCYWHKYYVKIIWEEREIVTDINTM